MKRILLMLSIGIVASCSNSNDDNVSNNDLLNASISPSSSTVMGGFNNDVTFTITKDGKTLANSNYSWTASSDLIVKNPTNNNNGSYLAKIIGTYNVSAKDAKGNSLSATVEVKPSITDVPEIPFMKNGATASDIKNNVTWTLVSETSKKITFEKGDFVLQYIVIYQNSNVFDSVIYYNKSQNFDQTKFVLYCNERYVTQFEGSHWNFKNPIDKKYCTVGFDLMTVPGNITQKVLTYTLYGY
ncbi:hypothetical protein CLU96_1239 [Chryseobacterium sp. 52]|uniref:hypothetical protein n=1 Tax=Chryseobacterium sp. 52 TaxID=2035213 RepID=UPI000C18C045|nr:hypothetical protein [Chryseobacterium sp. 52]PIF44298.1 hypothetical protein CLU96_1239 [Chryseobacterium sp. 52]